MWRVILVLVACGGGGKSAPPAPPKATVVCLAEGLGKLRDVETIDTTCTEQPNCREKCTAGDAAACMHHAYALQRAEREQDAESAFARACKLGLAIGCTNYGAGLWAHTGDEACASRLFDRACEVREAFGCGMRGRMLADNADTPARKDEARRFFDRMCSDLGGMICRMYAFHLEEGDLGEFEPTTVKALMLRACNTGDDDACGKATAGETFH